MRNALTPLHLVLCGLRARPARAALTFAAVTVAFVLYGVLAALENGLLRHSDALVTPRLVTTEAASYLNMLPTRYRNRIVVLDGVDATTYLSPFRGRHSDAAAPFAQYAVHAPSFLDVYPELVLDGSSRDRWLAIRTGAIVGRDLAARFRWTVGDRVPLAGTIYRNRDREAWEFTVEGIYRSTDRSFDEDRMFFHHDYLEAAANWGQGLTRTVVTRLRPGADAGEVGLRIDDEFDNSPAETRTSTERDYTQEFVNRFGNFRSLIRSFTAAIFFVVLVVIANAISLSVRERMAEYALMRCIGFGNVRVALLLVGEPLLLCCAASGVGMAAAPLLLPFLQGVGGGLTSLYLTGWDIVRGCLWMAVLVSVSALVPTLAASRSSMAGILGRLER